MGIFSSLFSIFKRENSYDENAIKDAALQLFAPVSGATVALEDVPDLVISEKIVGDGIAISPENDRLIAPCSGIISRIIASNNAFAVKTDSGVEVYVTCGIGANAFTGIGFKALVSLGDRVEAGDEVIEVNFKEASKVLESTVTSMIVIRSSAKIAKVISPFSRVEAGKPCSFVFTEDN